MSFLLLAEFLVALSHSWQKGEKNSLLTFSICISQGNSVCVDHKEQQLHQEVRKYTWVHGLPETKTTIRKWLLSSLMWWAVAGLVRPTSETTGAITRSCVRNPGSSFRDGKIWELKENHLVFVVAMISTPRGHYYMFLYFKASLQLLEKNIFRVWTSKTLAKCMVFIFHVSVINSQ